MSTPFDNAGLYLIQTLFDLYISIVLLRIMLQWTGANFSNPLLQSVVKITQPIIQPLRKLIQPFRGIDLAAVLVLLALEIVKIMWLFWLQNHVFPHFAGVIILGFAELLNQLTNIFFYALIGMIIFSWISPTQYNPLAEVTYYLTEPLLRPVRHCVPIIAGLDLSPVLIMLGLKLLGIILVNPLAAIGFNLATGAA